VGFDGQPADRAGIDPELMRAGIDPARLAVTLAVLAELHHLHDDHLLHYNHHLDDDDDGKNDHQHDTRSISKLSIWLVAV
jgi:hypothetical protein